jgi:hypothetical protein
VAGIAATQTLTNKTLTNPTVTSYVESVVAIGTVTSSSTLSLTNGTVQTATLTASTACTFTMPTATAGKSFVLLLKQAAATGNGTATFTSVKWGTAGAPTITATAGKMDILTFLADGTNWYGSAAQGDPIYEAGVQLGRLLRTAFLADYFVKDAFRNELRRVLNRGEAVNALKRAIYTGRISPAQAKRVDEMQAVADALSLMANIVMAWNTSQMQAVLDRWSNRRQVIPPELIGKIAPTRLESINLRGVFRFPVDRYADQILPSRPNASITGTNG